MSLFAFDWKICLTWLYFKWLLKKIYFLWLLYSFVKLKVRIIVSTNCKALIHQFFIHLFFYSWNYFINYCLYLLNCFNFIWKFPIINFQLIVKILELTNMNTSNFNLTFGNWSYEFGYEFDWQTFINEYNLQNNPTYWRQKMIKNSIIIICYSIIFIISLFGNCLVCYVILSTRQMRTVTNFYIANLTISDIMMTLVNIPFNVMRFLLDDWPFGELLCKCVPFIQAASV
jgi:hypothetical protein